MRHSDGSRDQLSSTWNAGSTSSSDAESGTGLNFRCVVEQQQAADPAANSHPNKMPSTTASVDNYRAAASSRRPSVDANYRNYASPNYRVSSTASSIPPPSLLKPSAARGPSPSRKRPSSTSCLYAAEQHDAVASEGSATVEHLPQTRKKSTKATPSTAATGEQKASSPTSAAHTLWCTLLLVFLYATSDCGKLMSQSFYLGADPRLNVHSLNIASKAVDLVISVVLTPILFGSAGARELFSWAEIWSNMLPSLGLAFTQGLQLIQLFFLTPGETIIGQLRIPLTAICSAWVLRKPYSKEQWMPLITITCAVFLFQLVKYQGKDTLGAASLVIGCCLGLTSCLAAVLSFLYRESLMKKSSSTSFIIQNFQFNISMFVWHVGLCFVVFPYASGLLSALGKAEVAKTQLFSTRGAIFQCRTSWEQRFEDLGSKLAGEIAGDDQFSKDLHMVWMSRLAPGTRRKVRKAIEKSASAAGEGGETRAGPRCQSFLGRENAAPPSQEARGDQLRPGDNWKVSAEAAGGVLGRANAAPPSLGAREEDLLRSDDNWKVSSTEDINEQNGPAGGAQLELDKETTSNAALNASARSLGVASADSAGARSTSSDGDAMEQIKAKFDETARLVNGVSDMMNRNPFHADVVWASSEELVDNFSLSYPLDIDDGGELYHSQPQQQQEARGPFTGGSPAMYLASVSGRPPDSPGPLAPGRGSLLRIPVPPRGGAGAEPAADGAAEEPAPDREHYTREEQREDIRGRYSVVRDVLVNENNVYCRFNTFRDKKILRPKVPKEVTVSSATENAGEATLLFSPNAGTDETPPSTRNLRLDMAPPRPPSNASGSCSNNVGGAPPAGGAGSAGYSVPSSPRAVAAGAVVGRQHSAALSISWEEEDARHACFVFDGERKTWELRDYGRELLRGKIVEVTEESGHTVLGVPVEEEEMAPVEGDGDVGSGECSGEQPEQSGTLIKKAEAQAQLAGLLREHGDPLLRLKNEEDGEDALALVIAEDDESLANLQGRFESIEDSNGNRAVEGHSRDRDGPRIPAKDAERIFIMRGLFSPGNEGPSRCALICDASICREEYTGHWQYNYMGQAYYHEKLALHGVLKPYEGGFFKGWGWLIAIPIGAQCFQIWPDQEMWMAGIITKQLSSVYRTLGQAVGAVCNVFIADYGFFQNPESKQERKTMEMIIFAFISVILGSSLVNFILAPPPPTGEEAKKTQKEDHEKTELTRTRTADVALKESDADVACGSDDDGFPGTDHERKGNTTTTMWEENEKLLR